MLKRRFLLLFFLVTASLSSLAAEKIPSITLSGEGLSHSEFSLDDYNQLPTSSVSVIDHEGKAAVYEGVLLSQVLQNAGIVSGKALRGSNLAMFLVVGALDGYKVVFALPEIDPMFNDKGILLARRKNGQVLSDNDGPFQIIVPAEARHGRWVRQVAYIKLASL
jgi:hypothetical protein